MDLTAIPKPYVPDHGRILTEDERREVAGTVTPIDQIKSRTCKVERTNDIWRNGRA